MPVTPALRPNALATWAECAAELGLETNDPLQGYVQNLINVMSNAIERFCSRTFGLQAACVETQPISVGISDPSEQGALDSNPIESGVTRIVVELTPLLQVASIYEVDTQSEGNDEISPDYYQIEDANAGFIFTQFGWESDPVAYIGTSREVVPGFENPNYTITYLGGYVLPNAQANAVSWRSGAEVAQGTVLVDGNGNFWVAFEVTGDTGGTQPTWTNPPVTPDPLPVASVIVDGGVTWVGCVPLPAELEYACVLAVTSLFRDRGMNRRVASEKQLDGTVTFTAKNKNTGEGDGGLIPDSVLPMVQQYKRWI